jgi:hypothetical protein
MKKTILIAVVSAVILWFLPAWTMVHEYGHAFLALIAGVDPRYIQVDLGETFIAHGAYMNSFQLSLICQGGWMAQIAFVFLVLVFRKSAIMTGLALGMLATITLENLFSVIGAGGDFRQAYAWLGIPFSILLQVVAASSIILSIRRDYVRLQSTKRQRDTRGGRLQTKLAK